jgi:hypothetical protein
MEMTDPISGVGAKALSAIKPEQKKDEQVRSADSESQDLQVGRQTSDEVQLSDETVVELRRAGFVLQPHTRLPSTARIGTLVKPLLCNGLRTGRRRTNESH